MAIDPAAMANVLMQQKPDATRTITLIRHGATNLNNETDASVDRIRGWKDVPLSQEGIADANKLGDSLVKNPPDALVSSDLERAVETAKIISQKTGVPISEVTQGFRPWNVGKYAGQPTSEAVPVLAKFASAMPDEKVPGGESFNDFKDRFFQALNDTMAKYPGNVGIVTHHRNERLMRGWEAAGFPANGEIDKGTFTAKGDATATANEIQVPQGALQQTAQFNPQDSQAKLQMLAAALGKR